MQQLDTAPGFSKAQKFTCEGAFFWCAGGGGWGDLYLPHLGGKKHFLWLSKLQQANSTKLRQSRTRIRRETKYSWFLYLQWEKAASAQNFASASLPFQPPHILRPFTFPALLAPHPPHPLGNLHPAFFERVFLVRRRERMEASPF